MAVFQLVFHPLQDFEHPFDATRLITRIWPESPTKLDLVNHLVLDPDACRALGQVFVCSGGGVGLQPANGCLRKDRGHGKRRNLTTGQRSGWLRRSADYDGAAPTISTKTNQPEPDISTRLITDLHLVASPQIQYIMKSKMQSFDNAAAIKRLNVVSFK
jgi:hypothetical protein